MNFRENEQKKKKRGLKIEERRMPISKQGTTKQTEKKEKKKKMNDEGKSKAYLRLVAIKKAAD